MTVHQWSAQTQLGSTVGALLSRRLAFAPRPLPGRVKLRNAEDQARVRRNGVAGRLRVQRGRSNDGRCQPGADAQTTKYAENFRHAAWAAGFQRIHRAFAQDLPEHLTREVVPQVANRSEAIPVFNGVTIESGTRWRPQYRNCFLRAASFEPLFVWLIPPPPDQSRMRNWRHVSPYFLCGLLLGLPAVGGAQQSLAPMAPAGQTVTPAFEGWYKNADGTYSISFGYLNRNTSEQIDIPAGENNSISPGAPNQGQPTHFDPRRHYGVFAVVVPADFGLDKRVIWTIKFRDKTYAIPGNLKPDWEIDAIQGEASADNTPPKLRFVATGPAGMGPRGITSSEVLKVSVGAPLALTVFVEDDAKAEPAARAANPVDITWFKHQGTGAVTFAPRTVRLPAVGGTANTTATFSQAGEYLLRIRANDSAVAGAGHAQCCWTNSFVRVTVTP